MIFFGYWNVHIGIKYVDIDKHLDLFSIVCKKLFTEQKIVNIKISFQCFSFFLHILLLHYPWAETRMEVMYGKYICPRIINERMKRKTLWKPDLFWKWLTSEMLNLNLILFGKNPKPSLVINYYWFHFSGGENKIWIALAWGKRKYVLITISDSVILLLIANYVQCHWKILRSRPRQ